MKHLQFIKVILAPIVISNGLESSGSGYDPVYCTAIKGDDTLILCVSNITITSGTISVVASNDGLNSTKGNGGKSND